MCHTVLQEAYPGIVQDNDDSQTVDQSCHSGKDRDNSE